MTTALQAGGRQKSCDPWRGTPALRQNLSMLQDLRYACRLFARSPGLTAIVILTLALGIGANSAVFSIVNGVLLQPLPYPSPARLVDILDASTKDPNLAKTFDTYSDFVEYGLHSRSFEKIAFATWATAGATLTGRGAARNVLAIPVSEAFFSVLGVGAERGRTFTAADLARGCSVVLSDRFWRTTLSGESDIVGRALQLNRRSCTVLGVMPPRFEFYPRQTEIWMLFTPDDPRPRDQFLVLCFGRLRPGTSVAQAQAELAPLHRAIHPAGWQRDFQPAVNRLQDEFSFLAGRNLRPTLELLLAAVGLVLLIACLNVANLLLARASTRARELAVRAALGSGRARLIRQLLAEASLLAALGGAAGVAVAFSLVRYFRFANPIELPVGSDVSLHIPVLLATALVTMASALIFGLAPAWSGSRVAAGDALRSAGRGSISTVHRPLMRTLIAAEIALSLTLLAGASLLMRSVLKMSTAPLGFDPAGLLVMRTTLPSDRYPKDADKLRFYDELQTRLDAIPGADSAAIATAVPPYGGGNYEIEVQGRTRTEVQDVAENCVSDDYFRALGVAVRQGRIFQPEDSAGSVPAAIVNEKFVREYLAGADPLGKRVRIIGASPGPWLTVVGVVATEKRPELMNEMSWHESAAVYRPLRQAPSASLALAVRLRPATAGKGREIERALAETGPDVPVGAARPMREELAAYLKYPRFRAVVLAGFASLALLLAALGLHGLLAQFVSQRTREIGLRLAVGARTSDIFRLLAVQGGVPLLYGFALGMALTSALSRYLTSLLFDVAPSDPVTMMGAPLVLFAVSLTAMARPAWDAAAIDPARALREE